MRQRFDPQVVAVWLGHSESISTKHDTQVRSEDFAAAVSEPVDPPVAPKACETGKTGAKANSKTREKTSVFRGSADLFASFARLRGYWWGYWRHLATVCGSLEVFIPQLQIMLCR
ncbi:MAG: hypothetical protein ACKPJD_01050, partial [Planctomycetaceae bacterium]